MTMTFIEILSLIHTFICLSCVLGLMYIFLAFSKSLESIGLCIYSVSNDLRDLKLIIKDEYGCRVQGMAKNTKME